MSNGTYVFKRPLTILNCAAQDRYVVYASSQQRQKGVHPEGKGFRCPVHLWQRGVVYMFALRLLLSDWEGGECWGTVFDELATTFLGFTANQYMALPLETERYAALAPQREITVMATIKKRVKNEFVNYTVSALELAGV